MLSFHFFYVRKLFFLKEANALVLCPGGFGTLDETFEVLTLIQTGKSPLVPLVLLDTPDGHFWDDALAYLERNLLEDAYILPADLRLVRLVRSPEATAAEIEHFYGNYHSTRWRDGRFHLRLKHAVTLACLARLAVEFGDLCRTPGFTQLAPGEGEADEANSPTCSASLSTSTAATTVACANWWTNSIGRSIWYPRRLALSAAKPNVSRSLRQCWTSAMEPSQPHLCQCPVGWR